MTANTLRLAYQIPLMYYKAGLAATDSIYSPTEPTWAILYLMISRAQQNIILIVI